MADFRIVYFDEIDDPYKVTLLFQLSLFFPALPRILEEIRANDERYTPEFGIFAVTENGTVAAGHLLMRIVTTTTEGRLEVGGVNAVGTRPDFGRRGFMTAIMNTTHEYFREQGLEYSVLTTSKRLGAMMMYEQLGYVEIDHSDMAAKYANRQRISAPPEIVVRSFSEEDVAKVDNVYREAVKGSYGFIYRPSNFLKARKYAAGEMKPKENLRIAERGNLVTGYAYWDSTPRSSEALEIMAIEAPSFHALLADAEQRNPSAGVVVWCDGLTNLEIGWLKDADYLGPLEAYGRVLMKSLKGKTDSRKIRGMYGVDLGKFRLGVWDGT